MSDSDELVNGLVNGLVQSSQKYQEALALLNEKEGAALRYWTKNNGAEISLHLADELFKLFMLGKTCQSISKSKPGLDLGAIVYARIKYEWDTKVTEYRQSLIDNVPGVVQQTQLESADFIAKMIAAAHKLHEKAIDKFLVSGNPLELVGTPLENMSLKTYQSLLDTLVKATGQDQKKTVHHTGGITVTPTKAPSSQQAHSILSRVKSK